MNDRPAVGELLHPLVNIAREAGREILEVYTSVYEVAYKEDRSPLTDADRRAHELIARGLRALRPEVPVLSEEGSEVPYRERKTWPVFFLVDPLDGTKEFINRNGEFTVNIAMVEGCVPVLGVVHVPVQDITYYAAMGHGAYRQKDDGAPRKISVRDAREDALVVVASRSHTNPELEDFISKLHVKERISRGSALKFCLVAEGTADVYPRLGPTWEWDTGAGHAIVEEAGGKVVDVRGNALSYNKEVLKHTGFIAIGNMELPSKVWQALLR